MIINILDLKPQHAILRVPSDWYPLYINKRLFLDKNIKFRFFSSLNPSLTDCDCLFLSSRFFSLHTKSPNALSVALKQISALASQTKTIWFDFRDSTGNTQFEVLPYIDLYLKKQLLKDTSLYQQSFYGNRVYTDYIHSKFGINDSYNDSCRPLQSQYKHKLGISWSPGLLDFRGGVNSVLAFHLLTDKLESFSKLNHSIKWQNTASDKPYNMLALFNTNYKRDTVAWQRRNIINELRKINDSKIIFDKKIPLAEEISIRRQSKIILSLFGWGEICSRDFQTFIAGSCLIAPDTSHLKTWPTTHIPYKTYYPIKWDLSDVNKAYETVISDNNLRLSLAATGQQKYKEVWSLDYRHKFCNRLIKQINSMRQSKPTPLNKSKFQSPNIKLIN